MPLLRDLPVDEISPYLRQHRADPVDWYPWGDEALQLASDLDRPLFVSIGYSSCHWCHVMGHESFSDEAVARRLNAAFVCVKVDREERPDVDSVYMEAVQAATGRGGWPMSVFATPSGLPFLAGTYFPDRARHGMPAFGSVLDAVASAWEDRREEVMAQARSLAGAVESRLGRGDEPPVFEVGDEDRLPPSLGLRKSALERLSSIHDPQFGGFGTAPKFPQPLLIELALRSHALGDSTGGGEVGGVGQPDGAGEDVPDALFIAESALAGMASGGIYDHLGGGFARYSVDRAWAVPHFEKMLYDQALIARAYLHAWQLTGDARWRQVLGETIEYVLRDLRDPSGGLYSAEDADSEGEEGRFYVWSRAELDSVLGEQLGAEAAEFYGVTEEGNFEGLNVLHRPIGAGLERPDRIEEARRLLLSARSERPRPGLDDKVLTEWNAMMCSTLCEAALATGSATWRDAAVEIGAFLLANLRRGDGRVLRSWSRGHATVPGYAADYAWLVDCCTRLGEATGEASWTLEAIGFADALLELFFDPENGGLFTAGHDSAPLVVRPRDVYDGVTPAAGSVAAVAFARLGALCGMTRFAEASKRLVRAGGEGLWGAPAAFPELVAAVELVEHGPVEVVVTGERPDLVLVAGRRFVPGAVLAWASTPPGAGHPLEALFEGRSAGLAYVCRRGACLAPVADAAGLSLALDDAVRA